MPFTNKFCNISFLILSLQNISKLLIIICVVAKIRNINESYNIDFLKEKFLN